ncbi:hypothetical protein [Paenibacillus andongensis]|uniref:hypothetical protein n=1 Tax=Paenibacillus andongensis TaxID=2975482 RepID=UPI0021BA6A13|nr:hypothetical protein [Paenibacillus andongensis]
MDKIVEAIVELTTQFVQGIEEIRYEDINPFLDQRERLLTQLKQGTWTPEVVNKNKELLESITPLNIIIMAKIKEFKQEAAFQLGKMEQAKVQKQGYDVHYSSDAAYFDKRIGTNGI